MSIQNYCGDHILGQKYSDCEKCWQRKQQTLKNEQKAILSGLLVWNDVLKNYQITPPISPIKF